MNSIFDVMGNKETALTRSLLTILYKDKLTLNRLIQFCFPQLTLYFTDKLLRQSSFGFERDHSKYGRTDIEIVNDSIHLIIEAKIGSGQIQSRQANKYSNILTESSSKVKLFVFLSEFNASDVLGEIKLQYPEIKYSNISWADIFELLSRKQTIPVNLKDEFQNALIGSHDMKISDIDIWAVVVKGREIQNLEKRRIYRNNKYHNPIMVARREWDKTLRRIVINSLYPVVHVHAPSSKFAKKYNENNGTDYVYELGKKIILKNPIIKKFGQASAIAVTFKDFGNP